jgi:hypothetical protein
MRSHECERGTEECVRHGAVEQANGNYTEGWTRDGWMFEGALIHAFT